MENNDRQQYDGNFGEDIFGGPSDGGAVSEDTGSGDWGGGLLNWDIPQEEHQGFVEGEYDPGFYPQGEYGTGADFDPGFTPSLSADQAPYEKLADAPAPDPWGGTPSSKTVGQTDAGNAGIEMLSDDAGKADSKVDENDIEMPPEYVGKAGAEDDVIEMTGNEQIETTADGEVKLVGETVGGVFIGTPRPVSEDEHLRKLNEHNQTQVSEWDSNGELEARYKELLSDSHEWSPEQVDQLVERVHLGLTPRNQVINEMTEMLTQGDLRDERNAELATRYDNVSDGNHPRFPFTSEEYLKDYYKQLYKQMNGSDQEPDMERLDTYDKLRTGVYELWEQRDNSFEQNDREQPPEEKDESHTNGPVMDSGKDAGQAGANTKDDEIEMPPDYVGRAGTDAKIDENDIEMPPEYVGRAGTAGQPDSKVDENDIEMLPNDASGADAFRMISPDEAAADEALVAATTKSTAADAAAEAAFKEYADALEAEKAARQAAAKAAADADNNPSDEAVERAAEAANAARLAHDATAAASQRFQDGQSAAADASAALDDAKTAKNTAVIDAADGTDASAVAAEAAEAKSNVEAARKSLSDAYEAEKAARAAAAEAANDYSNPGRAAEASEAATLAHANTAAALNEFYSAETTYAAAASTYAQAVADDSAAADVATEAAGKAWDDALTEEATARKVSADAAAAAASDPSDEAVARATEAANAAKLAHDASVAAQEKYLAATGSATDASTAAEAAAGEEAAIAEQVGQRGGPAHDAAQTPDAGAQEPNDTPDPSEATSTGDSGELGQDPSGEEPTAATPTDQGGTESEPTTGTEEAPSPDPSADSGELGQDPSGEEPTAAVPTDQGGTESEPVTGDSSADGYGYDSGADGADYGYDSGVDSADYGHDSGEGGAGYGYETGADGADYGYDSGVDSADYSSYDSGMDSYERDLALGGYGEPDYEPVENGGFSDESFDSAW